MILTTVTVEKRLLDKITADLLPGAELIVAKTAHDIEADAKANLEHNHSVDTGNLLNSIQAQPEGALAWDVSTNVEYAASVELGSRAHVIRPVNKKALFWPGAAHPVAVVHHPGNAPKPYLTPAAEANRGPMNKAFEQLVTRGAP